MMRVRAADYNNIGMGRFPSFRSLSKTESIVIDRILLSRLGLKKKPDEPGVWHELEHALIHVETSNAREVEFSLDEVFRVAGVVPREMVCVGWREGDEVDVMQTRDLVTFFKHIWDPGWDDIDIFDWSASWVVRIGHDGFTSVLKSPGSLMMNAGET